MRRVLTLAVAALLGSGLMITTPPATADAPPTPVVGMTLPLHVAGTRIRDAAGRDVILRGMSLGSKSAPYLPNVTAADMQRIRGLGMNEIRLYTTWAAVMPTKGVIDTAYLAKLDGIVKLAQQVGIVVIIDMHQDLYGGPIGDGAPMWAYRPGGCPQILLGDKLGIWDLDYLSPATACAITNFWTSSDLQSYYQQAWVAVANVMANEPNVIGYDLINEPFPGLIPPPLFEINYLYPSQKRWMAAIRTVDPSAIAFVEPDVLKSEIITEVPPIGMLPSNAVYSPHLYGPWDATSSIPALTATRSLADLNFASSRLAASLAGVPLWIGEWGVFSSSSGAAGFASHVYDMADSALASTNQWEYGDPAYSPFNSNWTPTPLYAAAQRPYPSAVPGTLSKIAYVAGSRTLTVAWTKGTAGTGYIQAPAGLYPAGVTVTGAGAWSYDATTGIVTVQTTGASATITVAPAA